MYGNKTARQYFSGGGKKTCVLRGEKYMFQGKKKKYVCLRMKDRDYGVEKKLCGWVKRTYVGNDIFVGEKETVRERRIPGEWKRKQTIVWWEQEAHGQLGLYVQLYIYIFKQKRKSSGKQK